MAGDIYVARRTAALVFAGKTVFIEEGATMARQGHPILDAAPEMFEPVFVHFEVDADAEPDPAPAESTPGDTPPAPAPKDVRAWAAEQGIEVSTKGKLPQDVVDAYTAAQQGA